MADADSEQPSKQPQLPQQPQQLPAGAPATSASQATEQASCGALELLRAFEQQKKAALADTADTTAAASAASTSASADAADTDSDDGKLQGNSSFSALLQAARASGQREDDDVAASADHDAEAQGTSSFLELLHAATGGSAPTPKTAASQSDSIQCEGKAKAKGRLSGPQPEDDAATSAKSDTYEVAGFAARLGVAQSEQQAAVARFKKLWQDKEQSTSTAPVAASKERPSSATTSAASTTSANQAVPPVGSGSQVVAAAVSEVNLHDSQYYLQQLDPLVCRWIGRQGWHDLHPIQKLAIGPILEHKDDVIISASTAAGKTEAAFLPVLTYIRRNQEHLSGVQVLYISPLKALINDQARRLADMAESLGIKITPWHGDVAVNKKANLLKNPAGIVLITPESLESLLINQSTIFKKAFKDLSYIVIDEFHALMGAERGYQLQSQLHRIENLIQKVPVRIAISATFSNDIGSVASYLRANNSTINCQLVTSNQHTTAALAVKILGYQIAKLEVAEPRLLLPMMHDVAIEAVAHDIYRLLRGKNNLVFTNSRADTEKLANSLSKLCHEGRVPNEFFPHHGSLSKELRETLEHRLQDGRLPTTAICTSTLELGIDISDVQSIAQFAPPSSVASLRQRLGRSGRRDGCAVLRLFIPEYDASIHRLATMLCEDTVISAASINLLLQRWYEPPLQQEYAFSTLIQQTLSVIASYGSVSAANLYELLCKTGPFALTTPQMYAQLLRSLGSFDLIVQLQDGTLTLGVEGEHLVSNYEFFAAFNNNRDYRIDHDGRTIGRIPLLVALKEDDTFLFAGKAWRVTYFNEQKRVIGVKPSQSKATGLPLSGMGGLVHDAIREEMLRIYLTGEVPPCLDQKALRNFEEGRECFFNLGLEHKVLVEGPMGIALFPWKGDRILDTVVLMLNKASIAANRTNSHIELEYASMANLKSAVTSILFKGEVEPTELLTKVKNLDWEKFNCYLPQELKYITYAHTHLNIPGALEFFQRLMREL